MKINRIIAVLFLALLAGVTFSQEKKKTDLIDIKTSAQCEMCKTRIETALAYEKGVVKPNLDLETKVLTVSFKTAKTNPDKIRNAIAALGYDADAVPADPKAYAGLPPCCKKPDDPDHVGH